ncbi:hypothetical protein MTR67_036186 [Solanum verrucosum]|uniref:Uncharacterized protein n=1 Tax=Solanum verrucosum TaxID=315347 RepID=A0AAF0UBS8_SOLVR|nr:hypothetical protein MTR67_036186 [Solanum verrucosum]
MEKIAAFNNTAAHLSNLTGADGTIVWKIDNKGIFTINSASRDLMLQQSGEEMAMKNDMESKDTIQESTIFFTLHVDRAALEDLHQLKKDQMGKANECRRYLKYWNSVGNATEKKERWKIVPVMVDTVERKKSEMFRGKVEQFTEVQDELFSPLLLLV